MIRAARLRLRGCARGWVLLTSRKERGTSLAAFRIAVAMVIFVSLLSVVISGALTPLWIDKSFGGMRELPAQFFVLRWLGGPTPGVIWTLTGSAALFAIATALGMGGRWSIAGLALTYRAVSSVGAGNGGYNNMISNALWLLFLSQSTQTLSLDCRLRSGQWTSHIEVPAWPRFLAIGQLVLIYSATGLQKTGASWSFADPYHYSAVYWYLQDPTWIRFDMAWSGALYPLTQVITFMVWHFEVSAVVLLLVMYLRRTKDRGGTLRRWANRRDLRIGWALFGASMHIGIALLLNMGPFSWISLAYYACLWTPAELEAFARRCITPLQLRYSRSR